MKFPKDIRSARVNMSSNWPADEATIEHSDGRKVAGAQGNPPPVN
jgi:hypothetical protein